MTNLAASAGTWNSDLGEFISDSHQHLAEILDDYNRDFSLGYIPSKDRQPGDKPFAIFHSPVGKQPYIVRYLSEEDMKAPEKVLAWVFENDTTRHDVLGKLEAADRARELMNLKKQDEIIAQSLDELKFLAKTPLHTFTMNGQRYSK